MSHLFRTFSMESQEGATPAIDESNVEGVVEAVASVDAVESVDQELKNIDQAVVQATDAAEGLEAVQTFVDEKTTNGGLTTDEAKLVAISTEALVSRFQGNIKIKLHSCESFGGNERMKNTLYTVESIGETLKSMWEAIKRWVNKWVEKTQDWFREHLSQAGRMKKAAAALVERLSKKTGEADKDSFEMSVSDRRFLVKTGKQDTPNVNDLVAMAGETNEAFDKTVKEIKSANDAVVNALKETYLADLDKLTPEVLEEKRVSQHAKYNQAINSIKGGKADLGGYKPDIIVLGTQYKNESIKDAFGVQFTLAEVDTTGPWEGEVNIKPLSKNDIVKALGAVQGICDNIMKADKTRKEVEAGVQKQLEEINKIVEKFSKAKEVEKNQDKKNMLVLVHRQIRNTSKVIPATLKARTEIVRYITNVSRNWLTYCNRCTSNIVEKKA